MATRDDVAAAVEEVAEDLLRNEWRPKRVTHIEKAAYSILFAESEGGDIQTAIRAISDIQNKVNTSRWNHSPLVIVFPLGKYRLNVTVPSWARVRGKRIAYVKGIPLRAYSRADERVVEFLKKRVRDRGLLSNTVQESLAAYVWKEAQKIEKIVRNVEMTVPTPYPDPIRTRTRAMRDYGVTIGEIDAAGVKRGRITLMEAKAASGGRRRWENIIRRKIRSYKGILHYTGKDTTVDFVVTSNNRNVALSAALRTKTEIGRTVEFGKGKTIAVWVDSSPGWQFI